MFARRARVRSDASVEAVLMSARRLVFDAEAMCHSLGYAVAPAMAWARTLRAACRGRRPYMAGWALREMGVSAEALRAHGIDWRAIADRRV